MKAKRLLAGLFLLVVIVLGTGCGSSREVVVYTSVDQVYAEPVLKDFEKKSGIKVKAVYDVEATKTTGLVNRLVAEKERPQADVFWNSEFMQTLFLKEQGVLASYKSRNAGDIPEMFRDPDGMWTAFGGRARVIIVNTDKVASNQYPRSVRELIDPRWPADKIGIAYPMFGTTATHVAALYALWGEENGRQFFQKVKERGVQVVDGNSVVKDMVASGKLWWGLTDTDDALSAIRGGAPVAFVFPDNEGMGTLIIPNTVALIKNAPHSCEGQAFIDYLLSRPVEARLLKDGAIQIPCRKLSKQFDAGIPQNIKEMPVNFEEIYRERERSKADMAEIFVR